MGELVTVFWSMSGVETILGRDNGGGGMLSCWGMSGTSLSKFSEGEFVVA